MSLFFRYLLGFFVNAPVISINRRFHSERLMKT
jgi:hypothetical protein